MKITYTIGSLGFGGKERQLLYLLKHLPKSVEKQLVVYSNIIKYEEVFDEVDDIIVIDNEKKYKLKTIHSLYHGIKAFNPDMIHSWDGISPFLLKPICVSNRIKLINGSIRTARPVKHYSFNHLVSKLRESISHVNISNSLKGLEVKGLEEKSNSFCIHNGFDIQDFDMKMTDNHNIHDFNSSDFNVCMVGRFYPSKDHKTLVDVCESIDSKSTKQRIVFHAVGDGPNLSFYEKYVEDRLIDNFIFHGTSNNIPAILSKCDVGILLNPINRAEGISNAIMEYMAAKLPVIATNLGGTPELVKDNVNGYLVKPYDAETVVNRLLLLQSGQELKNKMGNKGRRIILEEFSLDTMIKNYLKLYNELS